MILLRSVLFNAWFYGVTTVVVLSSLIPRAVTWERPAAWPIAVARTWARWVLAGLRVLCGTRWVVSGRENLPAGGPMLIASNHQSAFDTMVWLLLVPCPSYVIKRELLRIPLFGALCRLTGMIVVDRTAGADAIRALLRAADKAMAEGRQIVIFPEGTRVAPGVRVPLQPGIAALAARTRLPVIPVATDSGHCWGRRAFRKLPGVIHVAIGAPIPAELGREELMRRLERAIADGQAAIAGAAAA
jgi:1-acyl-sn-glycerol-3-phosphate acyltransferase